MEGAGSGERSIDKASAGSSMTGVVSVGIVSDVACSDEKSQKSPPGSASEGGVLSACTVVVGSGVDGSGERSKDISEETSSVEAGVEKSKSTIGASLAWPTLLVTGGCGGGGGV